MDKPRLKGIASVMFFIAAGLFFITAYISGSATHAILGAMFVAVGALSAYRSKRSPV